MMDDGKQESKFKVYERMNGLRHPYPSPQRCDAACQPGEEVKTSRTDDRRVLTLDIYDCQVACKPSSSAAIPRMAPLGV